MDDSKTGYKSQFVNPFVALQLHCWAMSSKLQVWPPLCTQQPTLQIPVISRDVNLLVVCGPLLFSYYWPQMSSVSPCFIRTPIPQDHGPTPLTSFKLNYLLKGPISKNSTLRVRTSAYGFGGTHTLQGALLILLLLKTQWVQAFGKLFMNRIKKIVNWTLSFRKN